MLDSKKTELPGAMAFYHTNGFVPAFTQASKYAGKKGHVGTMLDVVEARLTQPPCKKLGFHEPNNPTPWDTYFTTMSAEYVGYSKGGNRILIVAHGVGPMSTLDEVLAVYRWEIDDPRNHNGGRITAEEFIKLESGVYGDVMIVDLDEYIRSRKYPFIEHLLTSNALYDPVLAARLGPRADEYLLCHWKHAMRFHQKVHQREIFNPYIVAVEGPSEYWVEQCKIEEGFAYAHLLSIGGIVTMDHQNEYDVPSWVCDVDTHDWTDGTRLIGVRESLHSGVGKGPDPYYLLRSNWQKLMEPSGNTRPLPGNFYTLVQMPDGVWFTQYHKKGGAMDSGEPEYLVTSIEAIGEPIRFCTPIHHYYGFFKYEKREVRAVVPRGANAFALVGDPENIWEKGNPTQQTCLVQPYHVEIDHTKRLMQENKLANDYALMMQLLSAQ